MWPPSTVVAKREGYNLLLFAGSHNFAERMMKRRERRGYLEQRNESDFDRPIDYLIDNNEELRGPEYQQMMAESRASMADLITDLRGEAGQQQLEHLLGRVATLRGDFNILVCTEEDVLGQKS